MPVSPHLAPSDLQNLPADTLLLDVRTKAEHEAAHIPGSVNVPLSLIEGSPQDISDELPTQTVIICRSGARAQRAQQLLASAGALGTSVLEGGIQAWSAEGRTANQGLVRWDLERQVRLVAGALVAGGVALSTVAPKAKWLSGAVGTGLVYAAVSNSCMMGSLLAKLPYNQTGDVSLAEALQRLRASAN
ncbi:rhodanese-like domain-containing protein [Falsarthrobacter nasiphocae]|uniref:Rhodanese-related sulfurtransferase n=1 Tax=Falsarthrobacter nasiphocae TaxID=189863 RepID=A0AAE3YHM0_9MICC|nr:rhodanese-like domain-containing protein [Falsarthrobacter nasiphocae]MDR6892181.1 rhodanese-related sulfurtransferase [Falsarthrobacter nasiphocae]